MRAFLVAAVVAPSAMAAVVPSHALPEAVQPYVPAPPSPPAVPPMGPAHIFVSNMRIDQCMEGLPQNIAMVSTADAAAPASTAVEADALLTRWTDKARAAAPVCYGDTGFPPTIQQQQGTISRKYKLVLQTAAKVASQTADSWMQCRFGATRGHDTGVKADPDFTRLMFVRNPAGRAISGFYEIVAHWLELLKLPPTMLGTCASAWPKSKDGSNPGDIGNAINTQDVIQDRAGHCVVPHGRVLPRNCQDAWSFMLPRGPFVPGVRELPVCTAGGLTLNGTISTANSALLSALWELPARCRLPGNHTDGSLDKSWKDVAQELRLPPWMCKADEDCDLPCELSDEQLASLFSHLLSDIAKTRNVGCGGELHAGEHLWPQMLHLNPVGRADVVLRLENLDEDVQRFEEWLAITTGKPKLPPAPKGCTIDELHNNDSGDKALHPGMFNNGRLADILGRSPDLQKRVCALYYHDFVCAGYELLEACKGDLDTWLDDTFAALMNDAPVESLQAESMRLELGSLL